VSVPSLVEFLQQMLKSSGETAEANNMVTRSECKTASADPVGGIPLVNFNFLTEEKCSVNIRRRYELQVSWLFRILRNGTRDANHSQCSA
jgi:hypothetical protein